MAEPNGTPNGRSRGSGRMQSLIQNLDDYLAEQQNQHQDSDALSIVSSRPSTLFVDWDGFTQPMIRHRNSSDESSRAADPHKSLPPLPPPSSSGPIDGQNTFPRRLDLTKPFPGSNLDRGIRAPYRIPIPAPLRIHGYDAETGYDYDYDGRIIHIHKDDPASPHSDYYEFQNVDADWRNLRVDLGGREAGEGQGMGRLAKERTEKVLRFIRRLVAKLRRSELWPGPRSEREYRRSLPN